MSEEIYEAQGSKERARKSLADEISSCRCTVNDRFHL